MSITICGASYPAPDNAPDPDPGCCYGSAMDGPRGCTCWRPVYDGDQQRPKTDAPRPTRRHMCGDCAYRPGSPERAGDPGYSQDAEQLEELAASGEPFGCHQGIRRIVGWRHPAGIEIPATGDHYYAPPIVDGVPYRLDGTPGELCAGWDARRRALAGTAAASPPP